jgi:hypothetical protein
LAFPGAAFAADHAEAPGAQADPAADLADFYAWNTDDGKIVGIVTVGGLGPSEGGALYDTDLLYGIHIDNTYEGESDVDVWIRFGQTEDGAYGVQVLNLPGGEPVVEGAVETLLDGGNDLRVWAGLRDDPFFFDQQGFLETLDTGTIAFSSKRDSVAGLSVTAIVVEMAAGSLANDNHDLSIWATTARITK